MALQAMRGACIRATIASKRGLHTTASAGYENAAIYDKNRPSYSSAAIDFILNEVHDGTKTSSPSAPSIVELGSGTGKFTNCMLSGLHRNYGPDLQSPYYASEPHASMLSALQASVLLSSPFTSSPTRSNFHVLSSPANVVGGVAVPAASASSFDLVVAAQAFHWFQPYPQSYMECRRLLRKPNKSKEGSTGGALVLVWNERDTSVPWIAALEEEIITPRYRPEVPRQHTMKWQEAFEPFLGSYFGNLHHKSFEGENKGIVGFDAIVNYIASISVFAELKQDEKEEEMKKIKHFFHSRADTKDNLDRLVMKFRTDVYYTRVLF